MSIIADTLARLQTAAQRQGSQNGSEPPPRTATPDSCPVDRRVGPSDRRRGSRWKRRLVILGGIAGLLSVAGLSFWWGMTIAPVSPPDHATGRSIIDKTLPHQEAHPQRPAEPLPAVALPLESRASSHPDDLDPGHDIPETPTTEPLEEASTNSDVPAGGPPSEPFDEEPGSPDRSGPIDGASADVPDDERSVRETSERTEQKAPRLLVPVADAGPDRHVLNGSVHAAESTTRPQDKRPHASPVAKAEKSTLWASRDADPVQAILGSAKEPAPPKVTHSAGDATSPEKPPAVQPEPPSERPLPDPRKSLSQDLFHVETLIAHHRYREAEQIVNAILLRHPHRWEPWFWKGSVLIGLGRYDDAQAMLDKSLAIDDTVPAPWVQRAVAALQRGRYGQALDDLRQAELLAPELPEVQLNLGYTLELLGQAAKARRHYRRFLSLTQGQPRYERVRNKIAERLAQSSVPPS